MENIVENLIKAQEEYEQKSKVINRKQLYEDVSSYFFKDAPDNVKGFYGSGYTPGFNDGDPCEHSSMEYFFSLTEEGVEYFLKNKIETNNDYFEINFDLTIDKYPELTNDCTKAYNEVQEVRKQRGHYDSEEYQIAMQKYFEKVKKLESIFITDYEAKYFPEEVFKNVFGTNQCVLITKDEVNTWYYDCGY